MIVKEVVQKIVITINIKVYNNLLLDLKTNLFYYIL